MQKLTLIIPLYNHPRYLKRLLSYYASFPFPHPIVIADGTSVAHKAINAKTVSSFPQLNITYLDHYPADCNAYQKACDALDYVKTPYAVFCAEDDFIVPSGIEQAVAFLEANPDFSCCHGRYVHFYTKENKFVWIPLPSGLSNESDDANERVLFHFSKFFYTFYAVHKTHILKSVLQETIRSTDDYRFGELLASFLTAVYGKIKIFDAFYSARELSLGSGGNSQTNTLRHFIATGTYPYKYNRFRDALALHLSRNTSLDIPLSRQSIDDGMSKFMHQREHSLQQRCLQAMKNVIDSANLPASIDKRIQLLYRHVFIYKSLACSKGRFVRRQDQPFAKDLLKVKEHAMLTA